jgi:predicted anti-sigma-YlaC factor YlaD
MNQRNCQPELISSYLDDELDGVVLGEFEAHLGDCSSCRNEVAEQRNLLGTLSFAFNKNSEMALPRDFAHVIAVVAESDMRGVRSSGEHRKAFFLCAVLSLTAVALLGFAARTYITNFVRTVAKPVSVVLDLVWTTVYDAAIGLVVISRMIAKGLLPESFLSATVGLLFLVLAVFLLSRSISRYHRTGVIE